LWCWGLAGNDDTKGWEVIPSDKNKIEFGGRFQYPVATGEIGFSFHRRVMDLQGGLFGALLNEDQSVPEHRFAIDGKWDAGIGLWFEGVLLHQEFENISLKYTGLLTLGMDYTFDLGNGLHVLGEHFTHTSSENALGSGETMKFGAVSISYPIGLIDQITGMLYFDWEHEEFFRFISLQRLYDDWSFYLITFWNPESNLIYQNRIENYTFGGKGFQFMVVFNY
jgi:hypothetical protein